MRIRSAGDLERSLVIYTDGASLRGGDSPLVYITIFSLPSRIYFLRDIYRMTSRSPSPTFETLGNPSYQVVGHDFKIWREHIDNKTIEIDKLLEYFGKRTIIQYVIGLDTEHMVGETAHYHIRFLSGNAHKTVNNKKSDYLKERNLKGLKGFTHTVCKNAFLYTETDILEYMSYAIKEQVIQISHNTILPDPQLVYENKLQQFSKMALQKKKRDCEKELKDKAIKDSVQERRDEVMTYLVKAMERLPITIQNIYVELIKYQREKEIYLENRSMTRYAHMFLQEHSQLSPEEIVVQRFQLHI